MTTTVRPGSRPRTNPTAAGALERQPGRVREVPAGDAEPAARGGCRRRRGAPRLPPGVPGQPLGQRLAQVAPDQLDVEVVQQVPAAEQVRGERDEQHQREVRRGDRDAGDRAGGGRLQREHVPLDGRAPLDLGPQGVVLGEQDLRADRDRHRRFGRRHGPSSRVTRLPPSRPVIPRHAASAFPAVPPSRDVPAAVPQPAAGKSHPAERASGGRAGQPARKRFAPGRNVV
ncbi:MAG: hypothetical protein QOI78_8269 [Actinomycetota bacterium]|nr:hypothetical protein [Actinomycetota bacterium]